MAIGRSAQLGLLVLATIMLGGCAGLQPREPIQVLMVGVEPLQGQGMELRMLIKLRIQNPNDSPIDFNGVSVNMDVQGKRFASGVSDAGGSVPRFGEKVVDVPVSISMFRIVRQALGAVTGELQGRIAYEMTGTLAGSAFKSVHFESKGEFTLPAALDIGK